MMTLLCVSFVVDGAPIAAFFVEHRIWWTSMIQGYFDEAKGSTCVEGTIYPMW